MNDNLYKKAKLLIHTSYYEGMLNVLIEAKIIKYL